MVALPLLAAGCATARNAADPAMPMLAPRAERPAEDEIIYFVLPDRFENGDASNDTGGIAGGPTDHGFDPARKGFYQGGDLAGLMQRLDYIEALGATAIWLGPIYRNKPVQGAPGGESAGYHGYWVTDFLDVDPHFGTKDDLKALVAAAHARGMKVYLDIITNHTADVIAYRECHDPSLSSAARLEAGCPYRSKADYPFTTRGGVDGAPINDGFLGDDAAHQTADNFARLTRPDYAYTPYVPAGEEAAKNPAWLNDPIYYHNRGESTFEGENSQYGDFFGLDDLMTEHPRVVEGFIEIFRYWISEFGIDGFRVDTAKHVNPEFWQQFIPAIKAHAAARGLPNFYIFAEAAIHDVAGLAALTHRAQFPAALDFPFYNAARDVVGLGQPTVLLADLFNADVLYPGGEATARRLPTFIGNHDFGRFALPIVAARPDIGNAELTARIRLAHALMVFARGVPVIYYGAEQGFVGDGNDQDARETMFPSRVASYNDNVLAGNPASPADDNFDTDTPLFQAIAEMARIYRAHAALRRGAQTVRFAEQQEGGVFALSRHDPDDGGEYLFVMNTGNTPRTLQLDVGAGSRDWTALIGNCRSAVSATGSYAVAVPPLDYILCRAAPAEQ